MSNAIRQASRAGLVGALALVFPLVFHAFGLGKLFLPMYVPLLAGAFFLEPRYALAAGALTPLVSSVATGMPPLYPIAFWMMVELGVMGLAIALLRPRTRLPGAAVLAIALALGRILYLGLVWATSTWMELPARALTLAALITPWPGLVLCMVAIPPAVAASERLLGEAGDQGRVASTE